MSQENNETSKPVQTELPEAVAAPRPTKIVSSQHLVSERSAELSELEYALIMASNAFNRWMVRC
ncbi:hypothetical protein Q6335_27595, partial [Klebsiella pneumoniae]|nr:hypothetical protein [Klebsiella pneumoniae]